MIRQQNEIVEVVEQRNEVRGEVQIPVVEEVNPILPLHDPVQNVQVRIESLDVQQNNNNRILRPRKEIDYKKEQQNIYENIETNNNTLKRNNTKENSSKNDDNTLKTKQDRTTMSTLSNGIPSVPRVHMGAGFMKIFNECPLEIHASYCWINNETRGKIIKKDTN